MPERFNEENLKFNRGSVLGDCTGVGPDYSGHMIAFLFFFFCSLSVKVCEDISFESLRLKCLTIL